MTNPFVPPAAIRLQEIPPYIFARLNQEVAVVEKQAGRKVLNLATGNPDIPPSQIYIQKYGELLQQKTAHLYPGYKAIPDFSHALIRHYQARFNVALDEGELLPLNGAKDGIAHLPFALFNEGDEVLVPDPGYPAFSVPAELAGAKIVPYSLDPENGFRLDIAAIEAAITPKTRYLWVNFPSNPTGAVATLDDLTALVECAHKHSLFVLYDHAYAEITFDNFISPSILQVPGAKDIAIEIGSFSKSHSFAGYRMGWVVGNREVITRLSTLKSQLDSGMSLPLQQLGAFALNNPDNEWQKNMIREYKNRQQIVAHHLRSLNLTFTLTPGSLYIWAKIPDNAKSSETFCMDLLHKKHILLTPGSAYGKNGEGYVRASFCGDISTIEEYFND